MTHKCIYRTLTNYDHIGDQDSCPFYILSTYTPFSPTQRKDNQSMSDGDVSREVLENVK